MQILHSQENIVAIHTNAHMICVSCSAHKSQSYFSYKRLPVLLCYTTPNSSQEEVQILKIARGG